jgi:hypothetical protein
MQEKAEFSSRGKDADRVIIARCVFRARFSFQSAVGSFSLFLFLSIWPRVSVLRCSRRSVLLHWKSQQCRRVYCFLGLSERALCFIELLSAEQQIILNKCTGGGYV